MLVLLVLIVVVTNVMRIAARANQQPSTTSGEPTMTVRVDNVAGIWPDNLRVAENRAADVFRQIGVHVVWVDGQMGLHPQNTAMFTLVLVIDPNRSADWLHQDVLGFASPQAHRAWVFWDRIDELKYRSHPVAFVLGDVMAHELGHLLLPSTAHSLVGIMRPNIDKAFRATETFTKLQARAILIRLQQIRTLAELNQ